MSDEPPESERRERNGDRQPCGGPREPWFVGQDPFERDDQQERLQRHEQDLVDEQTAVAPALGPGW